MSKHTPGPWEFDNVSYIWANMAEGKMVAQVRGWGWLQKKGEEKGIAEQEANGRMLAAAPEMYEALRFAVSVTKQGDPETWPEAMQYMEAALAKADGNG